MKKSNSPAVLQSKTPKSYKNKKLNNANFDNFNLNDYQVFLHLQDFRKIDENRVYKC